MVLVPGGGYAEYVAVHMGTVMKIPEGISIIDAAGGCEREVIRREIKFSLYRYSRSIFNRISRLKSHWQYSRT
jgi:hypothetical protein